MAQDTMTRVQAICVCRNLAQLCDDNARLPEDFAAGVRSRARDMEARLIENSRYPRVTAKMEQALNNMWEGLRRWDRDDEHLTDKYHDLESTVEEITDLDASERNTESGGPKGRETGETSEQLAAQYAGANTGASAKAPAETTTVRRPPMHDAVALRGKEAAVGFVLEELRDAAFTVIPKDQVRKMCVSDVLALTKSDRTQQLIRAAYYVGMLRGIDVLYGKIQRP